MTVVDPLEFLRQGFGLGRVGTRRQLSNRRLQVAKDFHHTGIVFAMESGQLVQDVMPTVDARMAKYLPAGYHRKGAATKAQADLDAGMTRVLGLCGPLGSQGLEVVVAHDQVVGDPEESGAEGMVAMAHQRTVGAIHLVTLITGGTEAGPAGDGFGVGVVLDGPISPANSAALTTLMPGKESNST
jgi:hypothetical protein